MMLKSSRHGESTSSAKDDSLLPRNVYCFLLNLIYWRLAPYCTKASNKKDAPDSFFMTNSYALQRCVREKCGVPLHWEQLLKVTHVSSNRPLLLFRVVISCHHSLKTTNSSHYCTVLQGNNMIFFSSAASQIQLWLSHAHRAFSFRKSWMFSTSAMIIGWFFYK